MVNKLILGTVQFGLDYGINNVNGQMSEEQVHKILDRAFENKIVHLDTAAIYGNSEERIGRYLDANKRKGFKIITKLNPKNGLTPVHSLESSLKHLAVESVDTIMFHSFENFHSTKKGDLSALIKFKGKHFKKIGISVYTNENLEALSEMELFDVIQTPFNAFDNDFMRGKQLKMTKEKGIEVHTRSVFLQGLFFMPYARIPEKLQPLIHHLKKLQSIACHFKVSLPALVLQYALLKKYIDFVLLGVDSDDHLRINLEFLNEVIPQEAFHQLDLIRIENNTLINPAAWKK